MHLSGVFNPRTQLIDALIGSHRANALGYLLNHPVAKEKGECAGKSDTPRSYTKLGALDGDYLLDFSFIPPELNLPTHA